MLIYVITFCLGVILGWFVAMNRTPQEGSARYNRWMEEENRRMAEVKRRNDEDLARERARTSELLKGIEEEYKSAVAKLNEVVARTAAEEDRMANFKRNAEEEVDRFLAMVQERKNTRLEAIIDRYESELEEFFEDLEDRKREEEKAITLLHNNLLDLQSKERIAYEELQRSLNKTFTNRLNLSSRSIEEMKELYSVCHRLSNPVPLYKAIYELYLKVELGDLIRRLGVAGKCGIYRITNVVNGMVYIGQSVNVGDRWKQHVKRGTGCEVGTIAGGKLYSAMLREGIWNFDFELLEECGRELLTTNEKFWIDHFNSKENGYNSKEG